MADFHITKNDLLPVLSVQLKDGAGQPVDLTGANLRFIMRPMHGFAPKVAHEASIVDEPTGMVTYAWIVGDTDTEGGFFGDFEATFSGGRKETFPNDRSISIAIHADLEATLAARIRAPLATLQQFAELNGDVFDPGDVGLLRRLEDASAFFRSLAHQTISLVTDDTVELFGNYGGRLWLPERPVLSVKDVSVRFPGTTQPTLLADASLIATRRGLLTTWDDCAWGGPDSTVVLTYTHGYDQVPEDVVAAVCSMASRGVGSGSARTEGVVAETMGQHSVQYAAGNTTITSSGGLTAMESAVIHRYRPVAR